MWIATPEIYRPTEKPAWEFVRGRWLQKMSPKPIHARLQGAFFALLAQWGSTRGDAFPELHVLSLLPGEGEMRQLVPDVCFYFHDRVDLRNVDAQYPTIAPDITIEVKSPRDESADIAWKRTRYLAWGVRMVVDADPYARELEIVGADVFPDLAEALDATFLAVIGD